MPAGRPCKVCRHPERDAIDRALVAGADVASVSRNFAVSDDALTRHRDNHIPTPEMQAGAVARAAADADHGGSLLSQVAGLRTDALRLLGKAEAAGDLRTALAGIREARECIETLAKLTGQIDAGTTVNVSVEAQILPVQVAILAALVPYPEARAAVVAALEHVP